MVRSFRAVILAVSCGLFVSGALSGCDLFGRVGDAGDTTVVTPKIGRAEDFPSTVVSPVLEEAITPGTNVLWCSTFQLAWNEMCTVIGEDIHLEPEPSVVAVLNQKEASRSDLDDASYVAMAGWAKNGIVDQIRQALQEKFSGEAEAELLPDPGSLGPDDMVAYAFLLKNLEFPVPFEVLDQPLSFAGTDVAGFGIQTGKEGQADMLAQVSILDYQSPDDFIIELKTKSVDDHVILAKVQPGDTLRTTIDQVTARIAAGTPEAMVDGDELKVPKLDFKIMREYRELENKDVIVNNPEVSKDLVVSAALQTIRFQMNEKGVKLVSEGGLVFSGPSAPPMPHVMIFDRPYLIMMKRTSAAQPFFALWVDNVELLATE